MTPQEQAFLHGKPVSPPDPKPAGILENGRPRQQVSKHVSIQKPAALVTFTVRLSADRVERLKDVALKRKIARLPLSTQQDIIQAAVDQWLEEND
jgi:hypothetical protein